MAKSLYLAFEVDGHFEGVFEEPYARVPVVDDGGCNAEFETFWAGTRKVVRVLSITDDELTELQALKQDNEVLEVRNSELAAQINDLEEKLHQMTKDEK